jgi:PfaD family protein
MSAQVKSIGQWTATSSRPVFEPDRFSEIISNVREPIHIVINPANQMIGLAVDGTVGSENAAGNTSDTPPHPSYPLVGTVPALYPEWLGDQEFQKTHKTRFAYVGGAMARGITSVDMVIELAKCGMLCFFGSAGLSLKAVEENVTRIKSELEPLGLSWGSNLIHTPAKPELEESMVELYLRLGVHRISAAAFMTISKNIVHYSCKGLHKDAQGKVCRTNHVFAKISRPEVAKHFMSPAPGSILKALVAEGKLTEEEAALAAQVPLAEDITVEADSGGHTDNRPLTVLFSTIAKLRQEMAEKHGYDTKIRLGAAGGLGSPESVAAAFALGASYVLLGSVHQSCIESGMSEEGKKMLATACMADTIMTPSPDMFEIGGKVQVLKKGTLMGVRGNQLYEVYSKYRSIDDIPQDVRENIEKMIFRTTLDSVWENTKKHKLTRATGMNDIERAEKDPKFKMASIFKWYLAKTSQWAINCDSERCMDYQIWCGPAMGAFNEWVKGTSFEHPENRKVKQVALNLMEGAARITKAQQLRTYGVPVPDNAFSYIPITIET